MTPFMPLLVADRVERFYQFKKRTDFRFAVSTVEDLFIEDDELTAPDADAEDQHCRYSWMKTLDQRRAKMRKSMNKQRFVAEQLHLALEQLATDRATLMLERHLLAVTSERMKTGREKRSSACSLRDLMKSKLQGNLPDSFSFEALLDVDKNNNQMPVSTSTTDVVPKRSFQLNVMIENRLRQHFPKLLDRCRRIADVEEATELQRCIKLQECLLNFLFLKVERVIFKKSFQRPSRSDSATTPTDPSSTASSKSDDKSKRKRKQLQLPSAASRMRARSSEDAGSHHGNNHRAPASIENLFRDVVGRLADQPTARAEPSTAAATFDHVTIEIVDA